LLITFKTSSSKTIRGESVIILIMSYS